MKKERTIEWLLVFVAGLAMTFGVATGMLAQAALLRREARLAHRADKHCTAVKYRIEHDLNLLHDTKPTERVIGAQDLDELAAGDDPFLCTGQSMVLVGEPSDLDVAKAAKQIADQIEERP